MVPGVFCSQFCNTNTLESTNVVYTISYECNDTSQQSAMKDSCSIDWMLVIEISIPCLAFSIIIFGFIKYYYKTQARFTRLEQT